MNTNGILKPVVLLVAVVAMAAATAGAEASQQVSAHAIRIGVITGIPSCATSRGGSGALLRYRLSIDDPSRVREEEAVTVTLVFTIGGYL